MKAQVQYVVQWDKGDKKLTWSGTPYGVMNGLRNNGVEVIEIPIGVRKPFRLILFIVRGIMNFLGQKDYNSINMILLEWDLKYIKRKKLKKGIPTIFYTQYKYAFLEDCYYYQDLSVEYLERFKQEHPELVMYTPMRKSKLPAWQEFRLRRAVKSEERCRGYFTMSHFLEREYIDNDHVDSSKVHWVGGGSNIDVSMIENADKNGYRFLFIGKDWERKNGPLVIKAFRKLKKSFPEAELYVIGPKDKPEPMEKDEGILFIGRLEYEQMAKYYNLCDYFIMPSKFEGYGIVFAEALMFGLPCIGRNAFAMPEFITDDENGYLVEGIDENELCEKMAQLMINKDRLKANVLNKRDQYEEFYSWDAVAGRMIEIIKKDYSFE
jgi:glycosyltransferase involved in cell wall biosynthesis